MKQPDVETSLLQRIRAQASAWDLRLSEEQASRLVAYAHLLATYDQANVIGTKKTSEVLHRHIIDCLSCLSLEAMTVGKRVIDVGSGGGLPGLVVALAREDLQVTLLEAVQKKARFLEYAKQSLQVENATVMLGRAETVASDEAQRESYDVALTRAVASLPVVLEYCSPFVRVGGHVVAMKGAISEDELEKGLSAGERLGVEIEEVVRVQPFLGETESGRRLLVFTKSRATPERYPRRVGLAKKRPLGEARP